jgi:hypothetical protein
MEFKHPMSINNVASHCATFTAFWRTKRKGCWDSKLRHNNGVITEITSISFVPYKYAIKILM